MPRGTSTRLQCCVLTLWLAVVRKTVIAPPYIRCILVCSVQGQCLYAGHCSGRAQGQNEIAYSPLKGNINNSNAKRGFQMCHCSLLSMAIKQFSKVPCCCTCLCTCLAFAVAQRNVQKQFLVLCNYNWAVKKPKRPGIFLSQIVKKITGFSEAMKISA